jgi:hypothetical protein
MSSYYTLVQFVPNSVSDERINIGVVVLGDGVIRSKFLSDWRRVQSFGGTTDTGFLREFATRVANWAPAQGELDGITTGIHVSESQLAGFARDWKNSIQFTEPRASLLTPDELLADVSVRMLVRPERRPRMRDRRSAANLAYRSLLSALTSAGIPNPDHLLHKGDFVDGKIEPHRFDLTLRNGKLLGASRAMSFEGENRSDLDREMEAVAYSLTDVRAEDSKLPLSVVAISPRTSGSKSVARARKIFGAVKADLVLEQELTSWANQEAQLALA